MPNMVHIRFMAADGSVQDLQAAPGQSIMKAAIENNIRGLEGDCGGTLTCATCHVIVDPAWAKQLQPPSVDEIDMLDYAASPVESESRLSCQVQLTPELNGLVVRLPAKQH